MSASQSRSEGPSLLVAGGVDYDTSKAEPGAERGAGGFDWTGQRTMLIDWLQIHRVVDGRIVEVWSLYATDADWT